MIIAVIAADGRTGRRFVEKALAAGHTVRAGVRHIDAYNHESHKGLSVIVCDATNAQQVEQLIDGADAVASFIGHVKGSPPRVQTTAMRVLVKAMKERGVRRVVSLTGTGVRFEGDHISLIDSFLNFGVAKVDPDRVQDGIEHAEVLKTSELDWTIVRVLKLQNTPPRPFSLTPHGPTKLYVSRDDVANACLQVLEQAHFIQAAPILSRFRTNTEP